jgi:hypothetical protein
MQVRVFEIPMDADAVDATAECNAFLRAHKVLSVTKVAVIDAGRHFWSLCIEYLPRRAGDAAGSPRSLGDAQRPRVDYREILSQDAFDRFAKLRTLRKELAEAEGVPVYTVLTNAQLADLARFVPQTKTTLATIEGFGPAKLDRYAEPFLALLRTWPHAAQAAGVTGSASASHLVASPAALSPRGDDAPVVVAPPPPALPLPTPLGTP